MNKSSSSPKSSNSSMQTSKHHNFTKLSSRSSGLEKSKLSQALKSSHPSFCSTVSPTGPISSKNCSCPSISPTSTGVSSSHCAYLISSTSQLSMSALKETQISSLQSSSSQPSTDSKKTRSKTMQMSSASNACGI